MKGQPERRSSSEGQCTWIPIQVSEGKDPESQTQQGIFSKQEMFSPRHCQGRIRSHSWDQWHKAGPCWAGTWPCQGTSPSAKYASINSQTWHGHPFCQQQICLFSAVCFIFIATDFKQCRGILLFCFSVAPFLPFLEHQEVTELIIVSNMLLDFIHHIL